MYVTFFWGVEWTLLSARQLAEGDETRFIPKEPNLVLCLLLVPVRNPSICLFFYVVGLCHVKDWNYAFKPAEYLKHKCTLEQLTTADLCVFIYKFVLSA